jgi:2-keto-4-pentenoate hydratase/2-oxohepta-3-ene-1,7-dioic acid hydratase in catechol pathway
MKICRFDKDRLGLVQGREVLDVTEALEVLPPARYPLPRYDPLVANLAAVRARIEALAPRARRLPLESVKLLSPVANPGKIVAAPVNYTKHLEEARADPAIHHQNQIAEIQRVGLFLKATSALAGPGEGVALRKLDRRNDHEVELAVVIGARADRVPRQRAMACIAGYAIGLDMTIRGPEERSLRKSVDSYAVLGPWLVTADELRDPSKLEISLAVGSEPRQRANTRDLILGIPALIEFASAFYTLEPGDVLLTGTPEGVGPVRPGDVMLAAIEGIGEMRVEVRAA